MATFTVTIDGKQHEVDKGAIQLPDDYQIVGPDDVPDGFVKQSVMDAKISQRVKQAKDNALSEAHKNESVINQVLSERGIEIDEDGKPKGLDTQKVDLEKEREKWEKNNLNPVLEERDEALKENKSLKSGRVIDSLIGAFAPKFKEGYNNPNFIKNTYGDLFAWNKEHGKTFQVDSEGNFELHPKGKSANGHGYIEPTDYAVLNANSDEVLKVALKDESQGGSNFNKPGGGDSKTIPRKQFDEMDAQSRQKAINNGVQIVD